MSLYDIIKTYIKTCPNNNTKLSEIKQNTNLKILATYIKGGISSMTKKYIENLNNELIKYSKNTYKIIPDAEQNEIINAPINHNIRVIAAAGCGKTTTITARAKYLLDNYTTPDKLLILTFNVEAKNNLIKAMIDMFGFEIKLDIKTIDAFCLKIQRDFMNDGKYYSLSELSNIGLKIMKKYGDEICRNYKYIFFDEAQDMNEEQFEILRIFAINNCKLTVIADDSQNIYSFRGSTNYFIINFDNLVPNTLTYKITKNYRSTKSICDMANTLISNNIEKIEKTMTANNNENNGTIDLIMKNSEIDKIEHIIEKIKYYVEILKIPYKNIAVLSRNTYPLKTIETEFEKNKLPYVSLITEPENSEYKQIIQGDNIVLSTIHRTKGLEWDVCFLVGLSDSHFPTHTNNGLKYIEEERRLFYVAITRPRKYLHFIVEKKEVPISRFVNEIIEHIKCEEDNKIFYCDDKNKIITSYSVSKIIELLTGKQISEMKDKKIIPDFELQTTNIYNETLSMSDNIKKNCFESDFGIYCDIYMTRQLNINNKQEIRDIYTETILNINEKENEKLYKKICSSKKNDLEEFNEELNNVFSFKFGINSYNYPDFFIKRLKKSYEKFININNKNEDIKEDIYNISLCQKFFYDRRRLIYRNIKNLYDENNETLKRIDNYVDLIKNNKIKCKITSKYIYKINKNPICFVGELDYISNNCIVDIKCCESDFKVEWLIQLLMYFSLIKKNGYDEEINKLAIINILTGKYYEIKIDDYDCDELMNYVEKIIKDNINGVREKYTENIDITSMLNNNIIIQEIKEEKKEILEINEYSKRNGYIVLDVENNTSNGDIVQIAYIMYDKDNKELKRFNKYVKNRLIDCLGTEITKITNDMLRLEGTDFSEIIHELYNDLSQVETIVGHNISSDIAKIKKNIHKFNIEISYDSFEKIKIEDTMLMAKKKIKLKELYEELYGNILENKYHNAIYDVEYTSKCYVKLKKNKIFNFSNFF